MRSTYLSNPRLIFLRLGIPIRSNLSDEDTENYAALVSQLAIKAHHVVRYSPVRHIFISDFLIN